MLSLVEDTAGFLKPFSTLPIHVKLDTFSA